MGEMIRGCPYRCENCNPDGSCAGEHWTCNQPACKVCGRHSPSADCGTLPSSDQPSDAELVKRLEKCADHFKNYFAGVAEGEEEYVSELEQACRLAASRLSVPREGEVKPPLVYVASRASVPERSAMWRKMREWGHPINSSWIDEAGHGETGDFSELWERITREITEAAGVVIYAEPEDFPIKGALVEIGIALGLGKPVSVVLFDVKLEGRTQRPVGSWLAHPLVKRYATVPAAIAGVFERAALLPKFPA